MRNIASKIFGKEGKYTYWLNNVMNFKAIPIVPETNITIMQSFSNFLQLSYSSFIMNAFTRALCSGLWIDNIYLTVE